MTMCDRFGEPLYKTNYVKKLAGILQSEYEKECRDDFISNIKFLYRGVSDYPYIYYEFKGNREEFDHIKRKCNKRYEKQGMGVVINLTVEEVTRMLCWRG